MEEHAHALSNLAILLVFAYVGGAILEKLKQPALVGYILVGLLLGPSVLGIVHDRETIGFLAEMGILLLLFIVGMELDLKKFKPVYRVAILVTTAQIVASLSASFMLGALFDWPIQRCIIIGFAISLSSTAVAIKLLHDMKETHTTLGRTTIGILIAQDIAVIPMLLIIGLFGSEHKGAADYINIVLALAFMATLITALSKKPQWFNALAAKIPEHSQIALLGLALCFSAAAISDYAGLSAGYGAFLAGLVIGNTSKAHKYEEQIAPIFDVLMMVFFLSIGLMIDLEFMADKFWRILALLATIMVLKTVINISFLRAMGLSKRNSTVMGAALSQIGEFSFVLAALGLSSAYITDIGYKYVVAAIALSLVMTPLWLYTVRKLNLIRHKRTLATKRDRLNHD